MKQIRIGTCVPDQSALTWAPGLVKAGFECIALNFHMECEYSDLADYASRVREATGGVPISSIGFYCNPLQSEEQLRTLELFIDSAHHFGTKLVTTFAGALEGDSVEAAIPRFKEVFTELAKRAEAKGVTIAFENCPMDGTWNRTTCNIAFHPKAWEMMFHEVPSAHIGLEWEPAHQMIQLIEPLPQLRDWLPKIVHIHGKDAVIDRDAVNRWGVLGACEFATPRTPGFGDTDWRNVFSLLYSGGYDGDVCVEGYHDPIFKDDWEMTGQLHALRYLNWCRGGEIRQNPWDDRNEGSN